MKRSFFLLALLLAGCGGSSTHQGGDSGAPPAPAPDAFLVNVTSVVATTTDDAEPAAVDGVMPSSPEDTEPAAVAP